jgi:hypothetical protein
MFNKIQGVNMNKTMLKERFHAAIFVATSLASMAGSVITIQDSQKLKEIGMGSLHNDEDRENILKKAAACYEQKATQRCTAAEETAKNALEIELERTFSAALMGLGGAAAFAMYAAGRIKAEPPKQ